MTDQEDIPGTSLLWWTQRMLDLAKDPLVQFGDFDGDFVGETFECFQFCQCGSPGDIVDHLLAYMRFLKARSEIYHSTNSRVSDEQYEELRKQHPIADSNVGMFCAYLADSVGWTEHGGSVGGAWLSESGKAWLLDAEKWETRFRSAPHKVGG